MLYASVTYLISSFSVCILFLYLFLLPKPEWVRFLGQGAEEVLSGLGSVWAARVAQGEAWAWMGVKGEATLAEGVTTRELGRFTASDFWLEVYVVKAVRGE